MRSYLVASGASFPAAVDRFGDMVIAMVNNGGATLKRYYKEKGHIRLQPSNAAMEPIIVEAGTPIEIQGIVIGLIRKY